MIAKLYGRIDETGVDHLVIDVNGVGYLVQASARTLAAFGKADDFATVFTEMQVSENDMRLIGFATREERDWFRLLTGVQGVGGKVGLAILSAIEPADLALAIGSGDAAMVARANGVGPKLASRIVNELKDKVGALAGIGGGAKLVGGGRRQPRQRCDVGTRQSGFQTRRGGERGGTSGRGTGAGCDIGCAGAAGVEEGSEVSLSHYRFCTSRCHLQSAIVQVLIAYLDRKREAESVRLFRLLAKSTRFAA